MKKIFYILGIIFIGIFFVYPEVYLFSLPKFKDFITIFKNENTLVAIKNTLFVSSVVGILCLTMGLPLSWLLTRTDLPLKKHLRSWFCLPYAIPPFVGAIGWIILANPTSGVLNLWLPLHLNIYSFWGLVFVEASFLYTFVLISALSLLDRMDSSLEEAARLSGASGLRVFLDIALPMLKPAMINGMILSSLATAASFGIPALIGGPARIYLMTTQIYTYQRMGTSEGFQLSIAVAGLLGISTLIVLYGSQILLRKNKNYTVGGKTARPSLVSLNQYKYPLFFFLLFTLFVVLVLPLLGVLLSALSPVQGSWDLTRLSLSNFSRVLFNTEETVRAFLQSFLLGIGAAFVCTGFSFFFNYFVTRTKWVGRNFASVAVSIPFSTPGTVLALSLILAFSKVGLYNTLWIIGLAYVIKYLSLSFKTVNDGYEQIHPSLEEAARISGANWWTVMRTIYFPLLSGVLIASSFLVFMPVLSELTMTILLTGPGLETVGPLIFQFQEYSDVGGGGASVISVIVVIFVLGMNTTLKALSKGRYGL